MTSYPMNLSVEALLVHAEFVQALARTLLADPNTADDVVQDTWLAALNAPPRELSRSWFATVVRNFARERARGDGRRHAREQYGSRDERVASVDEIVQREATRAELVRAVLALPEPSRSAVLMRFYDGRSPGEIARATKVPVETVRTRIKRGLAHLRADLDQSYGNAWAGVLVPLAATSISSKATSAAATGAWKLWIAASVVAVTSVALWTTIDAPAPTPIETAATTVLDATESSVVLSAEREPARAPAAIERGRGTEVAGSVVDSRGKPVEGAVVYISKSDPPPDGQDYVDGVERELRKRGIDVELARTDASGRFAHRAEPGERVFVAVLAARDSMLRPMPGDVRELTLPADDVRFVLVDAPAATIEVRVVIGRESVEVSDFACSFWRASDKRVFSAKAKGTSLSYTLPLTDAPEDEVVVSVEGREHGSTSTRVRVTPGELVRVVLRYPSQPMLRGTVTDERGTPVEGALVFAGTQQDMRGDEPFKPFQPRRVRARAVTTNNSGAFVLRATSACVTAWHDDFSPITVPVGQATRLVMPPRSELRVRLLDDAGAPWQGIALRMDNDREATTDDAGVAKFDRVERGVRGFTLPDKRMVAIVVDGTPAQQASIGPWLRDVTIRSRELALRVRAAKEGVLVGTSSVSSLLPVSTKTNELVLPHVLPGSYWLLTRAGDFARVEIDANGDVRALDERARTHVEVRAPAGSRIHLAPPDTHELVQLMFARVASQEVPASGRLRLEEVPEGRWQFARENPCTRQVFEVSRRSSAVTIE